MAQQLVKNGATNVSTVVFIQDSSAIDGSGLTGLVFNTASLAASWRRQSGSRVALTLATLGGVGVAHDDGGFIEIDATNMPGMYRLDLPDGMFSVDGLSVVYLHGAANMAPTIATFQVDADVNASSVYGGNAGALTDSILDRTDGVEPGRTVREAQRLMLAALCGKLSGAATTTVTIRDVGDTTDRIIATVDSDGNRSAVTLDDT